jgi:uncharacterized protein
VRLRVAVISDTHLPRGTRRLPEECVERLGAAALILHAGHISSAAFLAELQLLGPPVKAVAGNVDEAALRESLPPQLIVQVGRQRIALVHDPRVWAGREARLLRRFPDCEAIVYGHTHLPQVERWQGVWILNPGSPTERRRAPSRSMLELSVKREGIVPRLIDVGR